VSVNNHLMLCLPERYDACGGLENGRYLHLSSYPRHLRSLLLASTGNWLREKITIPLTSSTGLQTPVDSLALWQANHIVEGKSDCRKVYRFPEKKTPDIPRLT